MNFLDVRWIVFYCNKRLEISIFIHFCEYFRPQGRLKHWKKSSISSTLFSAASALLSFSPGRWMQNPKNRLSDQPSNDDKGKLMIKRKIKKIKTNEYFLILAKMKLTILKDQTHIIEEYFSGSPQDFSQITSLTVALWPGKFDFHRTFLVKL